MSEDTIANLAPPGMTALDHGVERGVAWATVEAPMYGAVNGYVHIPSDHPWSDVYYDRIPADVSGGLTYGNGDWIGFDTLHFGDFWPGCPDDWREGSTTWTPELVVEETKRLARQVALVVAPSEDYQLGFNEAMRRARAAVEAVAS